MLDPEARKPLVIQMRGTAEWKSWVERLARHDSRAVASLVERALQAYAKQIGFDEAPPQR